MAQKAHYILVPCDGKRIAKPHASPYPETTWGNFRSLILSYRNEGYKAETIVGLLRNNPRAVEANFRPTLSQLNRRFVIWKRQEQLGSGIATPTAAISCDARVPDRQNNRTSPTQHAFQRQDSCSNVRQSIATASLLDASKAFQDSRARQHQTTIDDSSSPTGWPLGQNLSVDFDDHHSQVPTTVEPHCMFLASPSQMITPRDMTLACPAADFSALLGSGDDHFLTMHLPLEQDHSIPTMEMDLDECDFLDYLNPSPQRRNSEPASLTSSLSRMTISERFSLFQSDGLSNKDLDDGYKIRPSSFYKVGRVIALLWRSDMTIPQPGDRQLPREKVFTHIRRMVIVKEGHGFSLTVPINTYGGRGLTKRGLNEEDIYAHARIYMEGKVSQWVDGEPRLKKRDIAVTPALKQKLHSSSRIYFAKVHTIAHNVRVMDVGMIAARSLPYLIRYFREQMIEGSQNQTLVPDDAESGLELEGDRLPGI